MSKIKIVLDSNDEEVRWITIKGRKVPIRKGQSIKEAIEQSKDPKGYALRKAKKEGKAGIPLTKAQEKEKKEKEKLQSKDPKTAGQWKERVRALKQALEHCRKTGDFIYVGNIYKDNLTEDLYTQVQGYYRNVGGKRIWTAQYYRKALEYGEGLITVLANVEGNLRKLIKQTPDGEARWALELKHRNLVEYINNIKAERQIIKNLRKKYGKPSKEDFISDKEKQITKDFFNLMDEVEDIVGDIARRWTVPEGGYQGEKFYCQLHDRNHFYASGWGITCLERLARAGLSPIPVNEQGERMDQPPVVPTPEEVEEAWEEYETEEATGPPSPIRILRDPSEEETNRSLIVRANKKMDKAREWMNQANYGEARAEMRDARQLIDQLTRPDMEERLLERWRRFDRDLIDLEEEIISEELNLEGELELLDIDPVEEIIHIEIPSEPERPPPPSDDGFYIDLANERLRLANRQIENGFFGTARETMGQAYTAINHIQNQEIHDGLLNDFEIIISDLNRRESIYNEEGQRRQAEREASELRVDVQSTMRRYRRRITSYLDEPLQPDISAARTALNLIRRKVDTLPEGSLKERLKVGIIRIKNKIDRAENNAQRRGFTEPERQRRTSAQIRQEASWTGDPEHNPRPPAPEGMILSRVGYWTRRNDPTSTWVQPKFRTQAEHDAIMAERARKTAIAQAAARRYLRTHLYETDDNNRLIYDANGNKIPRKKIRWKIKSEYNHNPNNLQTLRKSDLTNGQSIDFLVYHPKKKNPDYPDRPLMVGGANLTVRTDRQGQPYLSLGLLKIEPPKWQGRGAVKRLLAPLLGFADKNNLVIRGGASPMNRDRRWAPAHLTEAEKDKWQHNAFKDLVAMYKSMGGQRYSGAGRGSLERLPHPERFGLTEPQATLSSSYYDFISKDIADSDEIREIIIDPENLMLIEDRLFYYDDLEEQSYEIHMDQPSVQKLDYDMVYRGNIYGEKEFIEDPINTKDFKNMKHDFQTNDFTVYHGPITREGPFTYYKNGKPITLYKDWGNINERFDEVDYLPLKAVVGDGSHHAKIHGFVTNFIPEKKPAKGNKYRQMYGDIVLMNDIYQPQDAIDLKKYHVSMGFEDEIEGEHQWIKSLDHVAMSDSEIGRCSTEGGPDCVVVKINKKLRSKS